MFTYRVHTDKHQEMASTDDILKNTVKRETLIHQGDEVRAGTPFRSIFEHSNLTDAT